MGFPRGWEWIVILLIVLLLFGASRLPQVSASLGKSMRVFKKAITEEDEPSSKKSRRKTATVEDKEETPSK